MGGKSSDQGAQQDRSPASSHIITTCATAAAILLFVALGSQVFRQRSAALPLPDASSTLSVAFLLNIAIILFGWRRSKDLKEALDAYEAAARLADRNANTDPTTGLANRRELVRALDDGACGASRRRVPRPRPRPFQARQRSSRPSRRRQGAAAGRGRRARGRAGRRMLRAHRR